MKKTHFKRIIIIVSVVFLAGISTYAFAGRGGFGQHMGYGNHMNGGGYMQGGSMWNSLSEDDQKKISELRDSFISETDELRGSLNEKSNELRDLLSAETVDSDAAMELQKEISALQTDFAQKRLAHQIEMKKLMPEGYENMRGFGKGHRGKGGRGFCGGFDGNNS